MLSVYPSAVYRRVRFFVPCPPPRARFSSRLVSFSRSRGGGRDRGGGREGRRREAKAGFPPLPPRRLTSINDRAPTARRYRPGHLRARTLRERETPFVLSTPRSCTRTYAYVRAFARYPSSSRSSAARPFRRRSSRRRFLSSLSFSFFFFLSSKTIPRYSTK